MRVFPQIMVGFLGLAIGSSAFAATLQRCGTAFMFLNDELTHSRNLDFESKGVSPEHAASWSRKLPDLYASLMEVFNVVPSYSQFFIDGIPAGSLAGEVLETVRTGKEGLRQEIAEILAQYRNSRQDDLHSHPLQGVNDVIKALEHSLHGLVTTPEGRNDWRKRVNWDNYVMLLESVSHRPFFAQPDLVRIVTQEGLRVASFWGELRAAFVLPNTYRVGITVETFADHFPELRLRLKRLGTSLRHRDIDVVSSVSPRTRVYSGHWAWTEVKTLRAPFDLSPWHRETFDKLKESIRAQAEAARILGLDVDFEVAFINGIHASAKEALYKLGYSRIHGQVFP